MYPIAPALLLLGKKMRQFFKKCNELFFFFFHFPRILEKCRLLKSKRNTGFCLFIWICRVTKMKKEENEDRDKLNTFPRTYMYWKCPNPCRPLATDCITYHKTL